MNTIQKKVLTLTTVVVLIMMTIWIALTYYNRQTQVQYNAILQRYLILNEVNVASQHLITDLNNYLSMPSSTNLEKISLGKENLRSSELEIWQLGHQENEFELVNYINLMGSLIETIDRAISLHTQQDSEAASREFNDAARIANYISDTTLALVDKELKTYDAFYRSIIEQSAELNQLGIWLLLFLTFSLIVVMYTLSRSITRPINQLTEAANALSRGEFDSEVQVDSKDELAFLAKTFNRMRLNINNLISEIQMKAQLEKELQENKLLLQESQFRSLQSQINPHFLFNTLNTISKKAYLEGAAQTSDLLVNIAGLLRYNLKRLNRSVTLYEEVTVLKQYIDIQKNRFTDRFQFNEEIDDTALSIPIPALTLQPIIENAVIHAIEPQEDGGMIAFRVKDQQDIVLIEIEDDGPGMSDQKAKQLLEGLIVPKEGHSTGIGFTNVIKRLRIFYGRDDLVNIESEIGQGTKISLLIPKQRGMASGGEAADC
ncbi:Histidine kinase-, DNA gyrase B-, and HSP90-like ATPase [Evansella caseinilytica]|uniref:histidine kinase n=1 Tax=Evansella caseinilytica TaxID=1503961 RepID=A0A1H3FXK4_9BACI|nr:sensor histidine kinase [Evansella caseinilytica]SDX95813.1 Histidine kinase-, DNA gyrase B-, and HSP90-like ATPase [Evansella caseinilytica]